MGIASTDAVASGKTLFEARGKVEVAGSVGAYGISGYQNDEQKLGAYVDTWFQYGWFSNRVEAISFLGQHATQRAGPYPVSTGYADATPGVSIGH